MASGMFNRSVKEVLDRTLDITTGCKVMLVGTGYVYNPDDDFISSGAGTVGGSEIVCTNYTGGFGGAGRKSATITFAEQDASNRAIIKIANLTWTALGGATNDTIAGAVLVKEITNDAASKLLAYLALPATLTSGLDVEVVFDGTDGNIRFAN